MWGRWRSQRAGGGYISFLVAQPPALDNLIEGSYKRVGPVLVSPRSEDSHAHSCDLSRLLGEAQRAGFRCRKEGEVPQAQLRHRHPRSRRVAATARLRGGGGSAARTAAQAQT